MTHSLNDNADETPQNVDGPDSVVDAPADETADAPADDTADDTADAPEGMHEVEAGVEGIEAKFRVTEYDGDVAYQPLICPEDNPEGSYDPTNGDPDPRLDNRRGDGQAPESAYAPKPQNVDGPEIGGLRTDSNNG